MQLAPLKSAGETKPASIANEDAVTASTSETRAPVPYINRTWDGGRIRARTWDPLIKMQPRGKKNQ